MSHHIEFKVRTVSHDLDDAGIFAVGAVVLRFIIVHGRRKKKAAMPLMVRLSAKRDNEGKSGKSVDSEYNEGMKITLQTDPISVNALYTGRRFLTKAGRETKRQMALETQLQWLNSPLEQKDIKLSVRFFFKDNRRDVDGCLKALLDSISGIVWKDDRQITELHVFKLKDKEHPRVELELIDVL